MQKLQKMQRLQKGKKAKKAIKAKKRQKRQKRQKGKTSKMQKMQKMQKSRQIQDETRAQEEYELQVTSTVVQSIQKFKKKEVLDTKDMLEGMKKEDMVTVTVLQVCGLEKIIACNRIAVQQFCFPIIAPRAATASDQHGMCFGDAC